MRKTIVLSAMSILALAGGGQAAQARGCIKGAVVGGVAGHYAGRHATLGAAAGCVIGHHQSAKRAREERRAELEQRQYEHQAGRRVHR